MSRLAHALGLAILLAGGAARAQDDAAKREARALFKEANQLAAKGEHARAIERFRAAYALFPSPKILLNMAATLGALGQDVEALSAYERYLADAGADLPADERAEVEKVIAEVRVRLGRVTIAVNEPGATLLLDGMTVGSSPLVAELWVKPGAHRAEARKEGFHPTSETAAVAAGTTHAFSLLLARALPAAPVAPAPAPPAVASAEPPAPAPAPPPAAVAREVPPPRPADSTHAGQLGLVARADLDQTLAGAAAALGVTYGVGAWIEVGAAALVGPQRGARAWGQLYLARGAWKPFVALGLPVFFVDGARPGVHAGLGLHFDASPRMGVFFEAAVERYSELPADYLETFFVPSLGAQARF